MLALATVKDDDAIEVLGDATEETTAVFAADVQHN